MDEIIDSWNCGGVFVGRGWVCGRKDKREKEERFGGRIGKRKGNKKKGGNWWKDYRYG